MATHATLPSQAGDLRVRVASTSPRHETLRKTLLVCGVVSSIYYVGVSVYVPTQWDGYSLTARVVSELSAVDSPTRPLWVTLMWPYTLMLIAAGIGVRMSAGQSRALRVAGTLLVANAVAGVFWPPMHMRGVEPTLTDTLHIAWSMAWLLVMLIVMGLGAASLGRRFRLYTFATLVVFIVFGTLTTLDGAKLAADQPTAWIGLWERINMAAGMLWIALLAGALLRRQSAVRDA